MDIFTSFKHGISFPYTEIVTTITCLRDLRMNQNAFLSVMTARPAAMQPPPEWSLYGGGHVIAATIAAVGDVHFEAQILLDGQLLYRSRHSSRVVAEQELLALRGHWATVGWAEVN